MNKVNSMVKQFKLSSDKIKLIATGYGACFATDKITVEGFPVRFMYREEPDNKTDSGWRFMSGLESDEYMDNPKNHDIYDVNTIANNDPSIMPYLNFPVGSVFEKTPETNSFVEVEDYDASN